MRVIGVVGGIGAGKSTIVEILCGLRKSYTLSADRIGHEILLKEGKAYHHVVNIFGKEILDENGEIIRKKLGAIVFSDPKKLRLLNEITHPLIYEEVRVRIEMLRKSSLYELIIVDAALLIEIGLIKLTDSVIGVYADEDVRIKRIMEREKYTREEAIGRIKAQKKWEEFSKVSDYIIDNSFSIAHTKDQLCNIITYL